VTPAGSETPPARATLVLATRNLHKVAEMSALLAGLPLDVLSCRDIPGVPDVVEDAPTLEGNAVKKAAAVCAATGRAALADDTGLEVEFLGGAPGVLSARYAGAEASYEDNNRKLLAALGGAPALRRRAVFRCVIALALPGRDARTVEGRTEGTILERPRGEGGFGYDPLFLPAGHDLTYAEMPPDEKNLVSHRGKAIRAARALIEELLGTQNTLGQ
jgi:XTP/dITP diphosphohydrolase